MSEVAKAAHVAIFLADFANAEMPAGKLNVIGGGITMMAFDVNIKATMPHAVIARVTFPPKFVGESPAIELALENEDGSLVTLPGPMGPQFLRVGSADSLKPAVAPPGATVPPNTVGPASQFVMHFANGLPLEPNRAYTWRVKIDHDSPDAWTETFYVFTADPGAVWG